ncbi:pullulanase [Streptomyces sp. OM5714]|nr:pullulanase [Streptomyces sp. OM5714]
MIRSSVVGSAAHVRLAGSSTTSGISSAAVSHAASSTAWTSSRPS